MATFAERMLDELSGGQLEDAKKSFASSLRYDDDDTVYSLAEELYGLGFSSQAKRAYQKLLEKYPDEDQLRTALADIAIDEDKTDEAIAYLAEISPESNAYIESLLVLADLYQSEGLNEAAEAKLREAYDLAPEESIIKFALAEFYFATGQYNTAIPFYRELLQAGERRFSGLDIASRIGVAYALVGNFKNALGYLDQIKTTDLTPDVRFQLGMTYAADPETADKAIDALEELQEIDPSYAGLYEPLGQLYEDTNDQEQALITYQAGIAVDAFNTTLYQRAAAVAQIQGEDEEADRIYREALENNPEDLTLTIGYSNLLVAMGDHVGNINLLNAFLGEDDSETDPQLYWNLAQSYTALEDFEMATKYWNAALPFFLDNINFLKPAYYYFREEGETALAEEALFNYTQLAPNDYEMAELYDQLKEDKGL
ncbi:tetratricopeptide repeat protein [Weissella cibaria]|uniref:tetratricopeptide repeat protein n=1 Tax=Weissella cibaria TaxID=137591 RepID=UPI001D03E911|nr:tetratricopeptide repeat protein [Weissella cibaria]MCB5825578.1 tetratricopeptide repeat protein [Weissella cibaria]MCB5857137.1 tetratricopeptide repeat protein [Weissella cibaria]MCB5859396.1 tetratricopeptide repeat protein [Weissella cibaria]MCB5861655.1 tetratricopeptide repeat protein [Weissella cibaria]MCB5863971.1 tetratricopeptide repeat protein [Weissella cibaria]